MHRACMDASIVHTHHEDVYMFMSYTYAYVLYMHACVHVS